MKRKLLSLLLCLLMAVSLLPAAALAQENVVTVEWYLDADDTEPVAGIEHPFGQPFSGPAEPAREGEYFLGWFYDKGFTRPFNPDYPVMEDTRLYPLWVKEGEELPVDPVILGTTWSIEPGKSISDFLYDYLYAAENSHCQIQMDADPIRATCFYDMTTATAVSSGKFLEGHTYVLNAQLTPEEGYRLVPEATYYLQTGEYCYRGQVTAKEPFRVGFTLDDAHRVETVVASIYLDKDDEYCTAGWEMPKGMALTSIATPAREGALFGGWYKDKAFTQPFDPTEPLYEDTSFYAKWLSTEEPGQSGKTPLVSLFVTMDLPEAGSTVGDVIDSVAVKDYQGNPIGMKKTGVAMTSQGTDVVPYADRDVFHEGNSWALYLPLYLDSYSVSRLDGVVGDLTIYVNGEAQMSSDVSLTFSGDGLPVLRLVGTVGTAAPATNFKDVSAGAWYYDTVTEAVKLGLVNGKSADRFDPNANMTFAEAAKLAACMNQLYYDGRVTLKNSTGGDPWYKSYVDYCVRHDILSAEMSALRISGEAVMECANQPINRQEYVHIFAHALPEEALPEINEIPDFSIPDVPTVMGAWSCYIHDFYRAGILNGSDSKGTFHPEKSIRRSEVATILVRMMEPETRVGAPADLQVWYTDPAM